LIKSNFAGKEQTLGQLLMETRK